ncbi:UDP-N-acetylmuramoyl-L-alanyl-D-glutamate--2,6-diaminopimelateligase [Candidatus Providencia siddallii]|uniref:UDP-N-acetylmuramoyl-L-alanyl-D-glutamate--2,6-diaminopimelate ligase n=1 Tax=Candidatus Providencia siddallii TaxID=1715285 RepID=A0A0M6W8X4_9GAMM|nr:UDP-N-acetylmuramoyl-L-alanyl-D-glutamate--2,6-diaminopimelateligase [Candidatus Providencia siddallii]
MSNRNFYDLLLYFGIKTQLNILLREMTIDSRKIIKGDLFIAIKGYSLDGRNYINQAIDNGASAVIAESYSNLEKNKIYFNRGVPIIYINNLNDKLSSIACRFYRNPSSKMKVVGITGTNGKTTITHLIAQWVKKTGETSAVMGTIGNGILGEISPSENTTSSAVDIQSKLSEFLKKNVSLTAIEISSHGLLQGRVSEFNFDAAVFTNLSRDHLDFHGSMKKYEAAKWLLFSDNKTKNQILNADDQIGLKWLQKLPHACAVTIKNSIPNNWKGYWLKSTNLKYHNKGVTITFDSSWGFGILKSKFIGVFNVSNLLLAMATLLMLNYPLKQLIHFSDSLSPICGRAETFQSFKKPLVIVDYAHTPDALKKILLTARLHCKNKLWCIFGCGGDRDHGKRKLMGAIAEKLSDQVILTNDNPREEDAFKIINDIMKGILNHNRVFVTIDRNKAVTKAILSASVEDVVVIAGKGHETYQNFGKYKINYSDRLTVAKLLGVTI